MILGLEIIACVIVFIQQGYLFNILNLMVLLFGVIVVDKMVASILYLLLGIELATGMDASFGFDCDRAQSYVVSCNFFDGKLNFEKSINNYKKVLNEDVLARRFKMLFKSFLGIGYWTPYKDFDFNDHLTIVDRKVTKQDIYDFMAVECQNKFTDDKPKWMNFVFNNYEGGTVLVYKFDHCISDGIGLISFQSYFFDNQAEWIKLKKPSLLMMALFYITLPFAMITMIKRQISYMMFNKYPKMSGIKTKLSYQKEFNSSRNIDLKQEIKPLSQKLNISINQLIYLMMNETLKEHYFENYGEEIQDEIYMLCPSSLRVYPQGRNILELKNYIVVCDIKNKIDKNPLTKENLEKKIRVTKQNLSILSNYTYQYMNYLAVQFIYKLVPVQISKMIVFRLLDRHSYVFSNVPVNTNQVMIQGSRCNQQNFITPANRNCGLSLSLLTFSSQMTIGVCADKAIKFNNQNFINKFEQILQKIKTMVGEQ